MKSRILAILLIISLALSLLLIGCSSSKTKENNVDASIDKKKKEELDQAAFFAAKCGFCHDLDRIEKSGHRGDEWENVLKKMYQYDNGANLTEEDYPLLLDYLKKTYK
ncbi:MAG: hypothetical protein N2440_02070 [Actinobacteria bacterium]|nr:hypothetical protein [Actinomycetota bacterium]